MKSFTKLSLAQGQNYEALCKNQTHNGQLASHTNWPYTLM